MYLNTFAQTATPLDMTATEEYQSLLASARDLRVSHPSEVRYVSRNFVVNGLRFHALEWGSPGKPAIVFLHGGNQTSHSWDLVSLHFADRFHMIALDQRGHGDTEWPRDGQAGPREMAADAVAIIEQLGLQKPVIVGHSMGGIVALTVLRDHPGVASRSIVVDVGPETTAEGTSYITAFIASIDEYASLEEFVDKVVAYDPFRSREHINRTARYNLLQRVDGKFVTKHDMGRRLAAGSAAAFRAEAPTLEETSALDLPIMLVRGAESVVLTDDMARRFVARLPQGQFVTVDRCGHNVHSQNVLGFIDAVGEFLDAS